MPDEACPTSPTEILPAEASPGEVMTGPHDPPPGLVLVSTPIGNLGDVSIRARDVLRHSDLILCEDTRHSARLLTALGVSVRTEPLHEHNEDQRIAPILDMLRAGKRIALVSDAGTPLVSDPGFRLVRAAIAAGLPVTAIPGPNAAVTGADPVGLPPLPFLFLGFPPPRAGGAAHRVRRAARGRARRPGRDADLARSTAPAGRDTGRHGGRFGSRRRPWRAN